MKLFLPLLLAGCALGFSCQKSEAIRPLIDIETKIETCNLSAQAIVQYQESHNGMDPFYYLIILDENGNESVEVYTGSIQDGLIQVGEKVSVIYHYKVNNSVVYKICGDDESRQATREEMAEVVICNLKSDSLAD